MEAILSVVFAILQIMLAVAAIAVICYLFFGGVASWCWSVLTGAATVVKRMAKRLFLVKGNHVTIEVPRISVRVADKQD